MLCGDVKEKFLMHMLGNILIISVLQSLDQAARKDLTPIKLRAKAAKFAKDTVKNQMASFKVAFPQFLDMIYQLLKLIDLLRFN